MTGEPTVLSAGVLPHLPATIRQPSRRGAAPPGIVHIGPGAFHRAHQAVYTEDAGDGWQILAVSPRSTITADHLAAQDCYFSVTELDGRHERTRVIGSISQALALARQPAAFDDAIAAPSTRVVTLTITEQGYAEQAALGQLVSGLLARLDGHAEPLAIVACDNLRNADLVLPRALDALARGLDPGRYRAFSDYLATSVSFPASVVDRITPTATAGDLSAIADRLGVTDRAAVITEPDKLWVLTDEFPAGRPSWDKAGAIFVGDVEPYEQRKLRLLNGVHSALAYLGTLCDHETIAEAVADPRLEGFARTFAATDIIPALEAKYGPGIEAGRYFETTLARFANPALRHTTEQVSRDGSRKIPLRILDTISERLAAGRIPVHAITVVAAWLVFAATGVSGSGRPLRVTDPVADQLRSMPIDLDKAVTLLCGHDTELASDKRFLLTLGDQTDKIARHGAAAVIDELLT
ncbi:mannitol dehydrogenase family protein [Amycolatopsis sp. NPDC059657]|uniref:mannitol dehydrogenase family protein n=1 Tax=Amycolatopsis sp. NPDC059657 TaxID=3346899 RepID=UPI00367067A5